ncbi:hypothetical protein [Blastococcus brunescens]|uniref:Uncharacterized protein n=1 Tax=Blastococcus brunescens TaxID=1564165 RepID=A0ABZ1AZ83_9ACTN|nr:hypothetical protein [Blastococcus sp. BMG 8361]WRL63882.1 hypothetical protein U6N30_30420 [Blastococcus sp. BMG 8361]
MSSPDPQLPVEPEAGKPPRTQEIPVAQSSTGATAAPNLPPHPGATTPAPVQPVDTPAPTGPVDFVPGLPGAGTPPPPPPSRPVPEPAPVAAEGAAAPSWPETLESEGVPEKSPGSSGSGSRGTARPSSASP